MKKLLLILALIPGLVLAAPSVLPHGAIVSNGLAVFGPFSINGTNLMAEGAALSITGGTMSAGALIYGAGDLTLAAAGDIALTNRTAITAARMTATSNITIRAGRNYITWPKVTSVLVPQTIGTKFPTNLPDGDKLYVLDSYLTKTGAVQYREYVIASGAWKIDSLTMDHPYGTPATNKEDTISIWDIAFLDHNSGGVTNITTPAVPYVYDVSNYMGYEIQLLKYLCLNQEVYSANHLQGLTPDDLGTLRTNSFANSATVAWTSTGGVMSAAAIGAGTGSASTNQIVPASIGTIGGAWTLNYDAGSVQRITVTSAVTSVAFSGVDTDSRADAEIIIANPTMFAITWPTQNFFWAGGNVGTFTTNGWDHYVFATYSNVTRAARIGGSGQ